MGLNLDKYNPQPVHSHVDMERSDASESVIGCDRLRRANVRTAPKVIAAAIATRSSQTRIARAKSNPVRKVRSTG